MTKGEIETIRNIIARLKEPNLGCSNSPIHNFIVEPANSAKLQVVSDLYLQTWIIPSLEMLLPEARDVDLAVRMSHK